MRFRSRYSASSAVALWIVLLACATHAAPTLNLAWSATTGTAALLPPFPSTVGAESGDILTLDITLDVDGMGFVSAGFSLAYPSGSLMALSAVECPEPESVVEGLCSKGGFFYSNASAPGVTFGSGNMGTFDLQLASAPPGITNDTLLIGRATFLVTSTFPAFVDVVYDPLEGIEDNLGNVTFPTAQAVVTPEPASAGLLSLGLLALSALGRNRRTR